MKPATSSSYLHSRCGGRLAGFVALALAALLGSAVAPAQTASPASHAATPAASARSQAAAVPVRHVEEEESEAKPNDPGHQGLKIHGHWKIDIKNPDGSLASTREFENSLGDGGALLSYMLASRATPGEGLLFLSGTETNPGETQVNTLIAESPTGYWLTQSQYRCDPSAAAPSAVCASNLNVAVVAVPIPNEGALSTYDLVLSGNALVASSQTISSVATGFANCSSASGGLVQVTPAQCKTGTVPAGTSVANLLPQLPYFFQGFFTSVQILTLTNPGITALAGQTIQVTVTLSFS